MKDENDIDCIDFHRAKAMPHLVLFVFFFIAGSLGLADELREISIQLAPVPDYPADGVIPPGLKDRFVFLDRKAGEIVVSFPENLGKPEFKRNPGPRIVERVALAINIRPSLFVNVQKNDGSIFSYEYKVENGAGAKQEIAKWLLSVPSLAGLKSVDGPKEWMSDTWEKQEHLETSFTENMTYSLPQSQLDRIKRSMIRKQVGWVVGSPEGFVPAGSALDHFRVQSLDKPGILTAYFQGHPYMTSLSRSYFSPFETPSELGGQMNVFNFAENNSVSLPTIGPKYAPSDTHQTIARDFLSELNRLIGEHKLSSDSAFTQELSSALKAMSTQTIQPPRKPLIGFSEKPTTELERQIYQAIQISFG